MNYANEAIARLDMEKQFNKILLSSLPEALASLYFRWKEEAGLEDFKDYSKVMKTEIGKHKQFKFKRGSKRRFGAVCEWACEVVGAKRRAEVLFFVNGSGCGWQILN